MRALPSASSLVFPPALVPGDRAVVVAPSSAVDRDELLRGLAWLRTRYRVELSPDVFSRDAYLAGDDARRRTELERALLDDGVRAIVAARGGYGSMRVLGDLPWEALRRTPKWIVGFSDVTALHAMAWRAGVASIHAPNVAGLSGKATPAVRAAWIAAVERPRESRAWRALRVVHPGSAGAGSEKVGPLVGGNLSLVHAMAGAGLLALPPGAILALEEVTEAPYRIDRMLTSLLLGGYLAGLSAIVVGGLEACGPRADGRTADEVIEERTRSLGIPVLAGAPFGHGAPNEAFVLGSRARIRGGELHF